MTIKGTAKLDFRMDITELNAVDNLNATLPHSLQVLTSLINGTTNGTQADTIYYDRLTASTEQDIDLLGTLTSRLTGQTISFVDVVAVIVFNEEAAGSGTKIAVGAASSNAWNGANQMISNNSGTVKVHPQGLFVWINPDGSSPTAGTGDILAMTPSASATWWYVILGRSA